MRARSLQVLLAFIWFLWTGLVLPGHTPGVVALRIGPDRAFTVISLPRCPFCPPEKSKTPAQPYYGCALCNLKIKLYSGTIHIPSLVPAGLLTIAPVSPAIEAPFSAIPYPFRSRAPPICPAA